MEASLYNQGLQLASSYTCQGKGFLGSDRGPLRIGLDPHPGPTYLTMRFVSTRAPDRAVGVLCEPHGIFPELSLRGAHSGPNGGEGRFPHPADRLQCSLTSRCGGWLWVAPDSYSVPVPAALGSVRTQVLRVCRSPTQNIWRCFSGSGGKKRHCPVSMPAKAHDTKAQHAI